MKIIKKAQKKEIFVAMVAIRPKCIKQTLTHFVTLTNIFTICLLFSLSSATACINLLKGKTIQGGLVLFDSNDAREIKVDGEQVSVNNENGFVIGFHKDETTLRTIKGLCKDGSPFSINLQPTQREYRTQEIDGLPTELVTPPAHILKRISNDYKMVKKARSIKGNSIDYFTNGFDLPVNGTITGFYGSQRILNGKLKQPHFGIDIAAPIGEPVIATASGHVVLVEDLYFTGWTVIISHGDHISSTYSHLHSVSVQKGENVKRGQRIGTVGSTGRSTGPHLDWRINLLDRRLDPLIILNTIQ